MNMVAPSPSMGSGAMHASMERDELEAALKALSFSNRLKLLELLREPRTLDEIHLTPSEIHAGARPDRSLTRQAVRHHLDKLAEVGLIRASPRRGDDGRTRTSYVLDEARLYAVVQKLQGLATAGTRVALDPHKTEAEEPGPFGPWPEGPKLVQVQGGRQGAVYQLDQLEPGAEPGWVLGRAPEAEITLQYDPYVSAKDTEIMRTDQGTFDVLDLRTSTNQTRVNGDRLAVGARRELAHGDILQVGTTTLVFHGR